MNKPPLQFKDSLPSLIVVELNNQNIDDLKMEIRKIIKQAPMMFIGMQLVIDYRPLTNEEFTLPVRDFKNFLIGEGLNLIAIMSDNIAHRNKAVSEGVGALPVLMQLGEKKKTTTIFVKNDRGDAEIVSNSVVQKQQNANEPRKLNNDNSTSSPESLDNKLINHPVRSGQRIYSRGDLIIVGSVSAGAEVIANGNIHVYGSLRGRAIAGAQGDENARVFCHKLDAELISIAGNYKPNEDIDEEFRNKNVQISLEGEKICFLTL